MADGDGFAISNELAKSGCIKFMYLFVNVICMRKFPEVSGVPQLFRTLAALCILPIKTSEPSGNLVVTGPPLSPAQAVAELL